MQCFWLFDRFFGSGLCDDWTCVCYMNWFRECGEVGTYQELERVVQDRRLCPVGRVGFMGVVASVGVEGVCLSSRVGDKSCVQPFYEAGTIRRTFPHLQNDTRRDVTLLPPIRK